MLSSSIKFPAVLLTTWVSKEAIRSIIISQQLLGTREIALFHHTDCGMLTFTTPQLQDKLLAEHPQHADIIKSIDFLPFPDLEQSVKDDVKFLKDHPLVIKETKVTGWIYDVHTGKVRLFTALRQCKHSPRLVQIKEVV
jgi:carbonic anhydrase